MNQNNNQVQQSNQVSQEDLAKTQVLNLSDVQEIAKFEKKTSKRPAMLFAFAGVLAITLGFSYPSIMTAIDVLPLQKEENKETIIVDNVLNENKINSITCNYTNSSKEDGTIETAVYNFIFNAEDKLQRYTTTITYDVQVGNQNGLTAVQNYYNAYKKLDVIPLNGYITGTVNTETGMRSIISVDLAGLDKTTLTSDHLAQPYSSVSDTLNETKTTIVQKYTSKGYICE